MSSERLGSAADSGLPIARPQLASTLLWEVRQGAAATLGLGPVGTGFQPLDTILDGGFLTGEVVLLGGQPGAGKTSCALQWARSMCQQNRRITFACFEHDERSLLTRLLIQELALVSPKIDLTERIRLRGTIRDLMLGVTSIEDAKAASPLITHVVTSLESHSSHLQLFRPSALWTTPDDLIGAAGSHLNGGDVLFVDYLQKIPVPSAADSQERVYRAIEMLKELAMAREITVVAISATMRSRIGSDRVRLSDLQGSDSLANECDIAILMNAKEAATSDRHLKFDSTQIEAARRRTIFSIEKNRRGEFDVHVEFIKDFPNFRFEPEGSFVTEFLSED
ncbi:MAG: AAA family ATPase [Actinomycetia bacterium]|nr:AAA family ATPase [Actinomycetes bacterium]MCP4222548.1 AAA family ATPase [Actinomycetes bacterium]MCP5033020.1 AAA family ATPase [Actinomycetes bacterium]